MKRIALPTPSFNPIVRRELRARWRGWRGYYPLLIAAVLLALGMTGLYAFNVESAGGTNSNPTFAPVYSAYSRGYMRPPYGYVPDTNESDVAKAELAREGRSIFIYLMMGQGVLCLLLAPALTASSVASEREAGMLEALQLSRLNGWGIARGKLLAALSLGALLLLLPLPAVAVCFFLGGVSPQDFLLALALQSSIFCCGACAGLFFGSRNRGPLSAYLDAYFYLAFYCLATGAFIKAHSFTAGGRSILVGPTTVTLTRPLGEFAFSDFLGGLNPLSALYSATGQDSIWESFSCVWSWPVGLLLQLMIGVMCFVLAARRVAYSLPERHAETAPKAQRRKDKRRATQSPPIPTPVSAPSVPISAPGVPLTAPSMPYPPLSQAAPALTNAVTPTARRYWHELPLERWLNFANPVLQREARARFRLQLPWNLTRHSTWQPLLLGALVVYSSLTGWLLAGTDADALCTLMIYAVLGTGLILPAVFAATAFSRERERDTWLALHVSLLPTSHIVRGKLLATLLVCALYTLPLWPPLLIAGWQSIGPGVLWVPLLVAATALFSATCGLWLSWRCRHTVTAVCSTLVLLALWTFATVPLLSVGAGYLMKNVHSQGYSDATFTQFYEMDAYGDRILPSRYDVASYLNALHSPSALLALNDANQIHNPPAQMFRMPILSYHQLGVGAACAGSVVFTMMLSALALLALERSVRRTRGTNAQPAVYTVRRGLNPHKAAT